MVNKNTAIMFSAVFNIPQGLFMTLVVSFYQGIFDPAVLAVTYVEAYCAGVTLSVLLPLGSAGAWASRKIGASRNKLCDYLVSSSAAGAIMGLLMNTLITFMAIGPATYYLAAWWHCLGVSIAASVVASCLFFLPVMKLVNRRRPKKPQKQPTGASDP